MPSGICEAYPDLLPVTEPNNIPFDHLTYPIQYKQLMDELIMKTHCHICETETKINNIFCSKNHYRIFANYGYQSCVYFEKYRYCSHCC